MGIDFEFFAYDGAPFSDAELARALCAATSSTVLFRHARSFSDDLHFVALYEGPDSPRRAWREQVIESAKAHIPLDARNAARTGSLASVVQVAWKVTKKALDEAPPPPSTSAGRSRTLASARALSRRERSTIWLCQADHSVVGGYAAFAHGELVDEAGDGDVYVDGDESLEVPASKFAEATGLALTPAEAFTRAFPDEGGPPLIRGSTSAEPVTLTFDPLRFEVLVG